MPSTQSHSHTESPKEIAQLAKAFGPAATPALLEHRMTVAPCFCGDIVSDLPLAQPTVSQHLKVLRNAGLIKGTIEGNAICYCIDEKTAERMVRYFSIFSAEAKKNKNDCC